MRRYLGILIVMLLLPFSGCREAITGDEMLMGEGMTLDLSFETRGVEVGENLSNAIKNMRIFLFSPADGLLKSEVSNIKLKPGSSNVVSFKLPFGTWDIVGVSNLESSAVALSASLGSTKEQLLYQFTYSATGAGVVTPVDMGANSSEVVMFTIAGKQVNASSASSIGNVVFKRMVGKVNLSIVNCMDNVKIDGGHEVEIFNIPTKLSFEGGLLASEGSHSRTSPETLKRSESKMVRKMTISPSLPAGFESHKSTFIIPAWHNYLGEDGFGNNTIGIRIKIELLSGGFYESTLEAIDFPKSLAANRVLYVKIDAKTGLEVDATIKDWGDINVDGDIHGGDLKVPAEVLMDWARFDMSFDSGDIPYSGVSEVQIFLGESTTPLTLTPEAENILHNYGSGCPWLRASVTPNADGKTGHFNFSYKVDATADKLPFKIRLVSDNITRVMSVVYDNGLMPESLMSGALAYTYFEVTGNGSAIPTGPQDRNGWAVGGFHFARRGNAIDPFTSDAPAGSDVEKQWQLDRVSVPNYPVADKFKFNKGMGQTNFLVTTSTKDHPAAEYCRGMGGSYYLPSASELKWIYDRARVYLGASYSFSSYYYWSATESNGGGSWCADFTNGNVSAGAKDYGCNVRYIKNLGLTLSDTRVVMDYAALGSTDTKVVSYSSGAPVGVDLGSLPNWLVATHQSSDGKSGTVTLKYKVAVVGEYSRTHTIKFNSTVDGVSATKSLELVYDNGWIPESLMSGALVNTYYQVTVPNGGLGIEDRNGWAIGGFHLARRGDAIDPFTNNEPAIYSDASDIWQNTNEILVDYPRVDDKKFNKGWFQTNFLVTTSTKDHPVAERCRSMGISYYLPSASELLWIAKYAVPYLGGSYVPLIGLTGSSTEYIDDFVDDKNRSSVWFGVFTRKPSAGYTTYDIKTNAYPFRCIKNLGITLSDTRVVMDYAALGSKFTKVVSYSSEVPISIDLAVLPDWLEVTQSGGAYEGTVTLKYKVAKVAEANRTHTIKFTTTTGGVATTRNLEVVYDNGLMPESLMSGALVNTYFEVMGSGSAIPTGPQDRNGWAVGGFHFARRGNAIDPFTNNAPATKSDFEAEWQTIRASVPNYPATDKMKFNKGMSQTNFLVTTSTKDHPAAKYCKGMGDGYYLPSASELKWIYDRARGYLGASYSFSSLHYWSATEYSGSISWFANFGSGDVNATGKVTGCNVRCVWDL